MYVALLLREVVLTGYTPKNQDLLSVDADIIGRAPERLHTRARVDIHAACVALVLKHSH